MPKITKRLIDSLRPGDTDLVLWDDALAGFGLRLKRSGAGAYIIQYRNAERRSRRFTVGKVGVLTPEEARKAARALLSGVATGKADPAGEKATVKATPTVAALVDLYLKDGPAAKPAKKASSWATDASNLRRHVVPVLGRRHLSALTKADIQRFQRDVTEGKTATDEKSDKKHGRAIVTGGPGTAARATVVLGAMLQWAVSQGYRADNPAKGVSLNKLQRRERFLSAKELAKLGEALAAAEKAGSNRQSLAAIRLLLLTGCRKNEILSLRWEHVDFEHGALRLPDSKTGAKVVPLGAPALAVLAGLKPSAGKGNSSKRPDYVFPAARGEGHHVGLPAVWRKVSKAAGLHGVRIHDLRHGFASVAVAGGSSLYIVGKVLGHTQAATTERYSHLDLDPVRAVADRTSRKLEAALGAGIKSAKRVKIDEAIERKVK